VTEG